MSLLGIARLSLFCFYVMSPVNEAAVFSPKGSLHDSSRPRHASLLIFAVGDEPVPGFQPFDSKQSGVVERPFKTSASGAHTAEAMGSIAPAYRVAAASTAQNPSPAVRLAENEPAPAAATAGQAPSLVQRLEGREGDLTVWVAIAVAFFLAGWVGGSIYARRRERSRRGKLRF